MRVGIRGSGLMGGKLGTIFARAGHEVVFSAPGEVLFGVFESKGKETRPSLVYCADDQGAKKCLCQADP
jgi:hypothetical protein